MKIGSLTDEWLAYSLCIETKDGTRYLIRMQFIAEVDDRTGQFGLGIGASPKRAVELLQKYGGITVVKGVSVEDGIEKVFLVEQIRRIYTINVMPIKNKSHVFVLDAPKKSFLGRFFANLADRLEG